MYLMKVGDDAYVRCICTGCGMGDHHASRMSFRSCYFWGRVPKLQSDSSRRPDKNLNGIGNVRVIPSKYTCIFRQYRKLSGTLCCFCS